MRAMERIGTLIGVFAFAVAAWYGIWTSSTANGVEFVGVIGLIMGGLLGFMIAFYLWRTRLKHAEDPRTTRSATSTTSLVTTGSSAPTAGGRCGSDSRPRSASSASRSAGGSLRSAPSSPSRL